MNKPFLTHVAHASACSGELQFDVFAFPRVVLLLTLAAMAVFAQDPPDTAKKTHTAAAETRSRDTRSPPRNVGAQTRRPYFPQKARPIGR